MSTSGISNLSGSYLEQALAGALQSVTQSTAAQSTAGSTASTTAATSTKSDSSQLSPFAELVSGLQQLQEANPTEYKQFAAQVATNLTNEAQTIQGQSPGAAAQLTQLAADFTSASQSGQLPSLQDLAQAVGGGGSDGGAGAGGGHHHHHHSSSTDGSSSSSSTSQTLTQLLSSLQQTSGGQTTASGE